MSVVEPLRTALALPGIQSLAQADMAAVDALIRARLASDVVLINQIADHIISAGGKRLRPMLVALAGRACGPVTPEHHQLAAIIEFIHTSTLLHDDVVDESDSSDAASTDVKKRVSSVCEAAKDCAAARVLSLVSGLMPESAGTMASFCAFFAALMSVSKESQDTQWADSSELSTVSRSEQLLDGSMAMKSREYASELESLTCVTLPSDV